MSLDADVVLPCMRESVVKARRFLAEQLRGRVDGEVADVATLLLSELVTNAVLHTSSDARVRVVVESAGLLVAVEDGADAAPVRQPQDVDALCGRGLELVEGLANAYGVLRRPTGKCVWFVLGDLEPPGPTGW